MNAKYPVRTRRIRFEYPPGALDRHYANGDLILSHTVAVLSALFPEGEDFFIRSVRHYADRITDPELKSQVAGFIGQEVTHGREHRALNDRLNELGYPTHFVDRLTHLLMIRMAKRLPWRIQLAITAALEHYTASIAELLLGNEDAQRRLGDNEIRSMLLWHALEESEHKAVAFDVYRATGGRESMRINTMRVVNVLFVPFVALLSVISLLGDRAIYNPLRLVQAFGLLRTSPFLTKDVVRHLRAYNRRGFHPDDFDASQLLDRWKAELFGNEGRLVDHLK